MISKHWRSIQIYNDSCLSKCSDKIDYHVIKKVLKEEYALLCAMHPHSNDQTVHMAWAMCALCLAAMCRHCGETCGKCNGIYIDQCQPLVRKLALFTLPAGGTMSRESSVFGRHFFGEILWFEFQAMVTHIRFEWQAWNSLVEFVVCSWMTVAFLSGESCGGDLSSSYSGVHTHSWKL